MAPTVVSRLKSALSVVAEGALLVFAVTVGTAVVAVVALAGKGNGQ